MTIREYYVNNVCEQTCVSKNHAFYIDGRFKRHESSNEIQQNSNNSTFQKNESAKLYKSKCMKYLKINIPMVPLKASLFLWWTCGGLLLTYFNLYILQLGITVSQISLMNATASFAQFFAGPLPGIIADKIGRCKPILVANLILLFITVNCVMLVPSIKVPKCFLDDVEIQCNPEFKAKDPTNNSRNTTYSCLVECTSNITFYHVFSLLGNLDGSNQTVLYTFTDGFNETEIVFNSNIPRENSTMFCESILKDNCESFCVSEDDDSCVIEMQCPNVEDNSTLVFTACFVIICFMNFLRSNSYNIMEVTSVFMAETHRSDFGHERFWAVLSMVLMLPLAGYLVDLTTPEGSSKNYVFPLYLFDALLAIMMIFVYMLDVQIYPPGRNMMKNSISLMKDLDVMAFALTVLVLGIGSAFSRTYSFIYLEELGSPSILMGLMMAVNSICGLPFLLTSDWWIRTLGSSNLLLCGFLGHIFFCLGYSFLVNVWHALFYETAAIFTYHLLWVAVVRHSNEIAPEGLAATVISFAAGIHWALGKTIGNLIGGRVTSKKDGMLAFTSVAILCGAFFIFYAIFLHCRKRQAKRNLTDKK